MFTPKRLSATNLKAPDKSKTFSLSRFRNRETPRFCKTKLRPTQLPEAGAHLVGTVDGLVLSNRSTTPKFFVAET